jgi:RNase P/RNase MRP subunit p29
MTAFDVEREHYRIVYPAASCPRLLGDGLERQVIDLSQQGLRYRAAEGETRAVGDQLESTVRVRRGEEVRVLGTVVRVREREVALRLSMGVPLRVVLDEQRYLRERRRGSHP